MCQLTLQYFAKWIICTRKKTGSRRKISKLASAALRLQGFVWFFFVYASFLLHWLCILQSSFIRVGGMTIFVNRCLTKFSMTTRSTALTNWGIFRRKRWLKIIHLQNFFLLYFIALLTFFFQYDMFYTSRRLSSAGRANGSYPLGRRFKPHSRY